jgi:hypothetical protein
MIAASLQASARAARAVKLSPTRSRLQVASFRSWLEPMSNDPLCRTFSRATACRARGDDGRAGQVFFWRTVARSAVYPARGDIVDFDRHDIAATELAVDRKIEHGKVSDATFNLEFRPD